MSHFVRNPEDRFCVEAHLSEYLLFWYLSHLQATTSGADPGFLERGFIYIKVWGFAFLILSHFS